MGLLSEWRERRIARRERLNAEAYAELQAAGRRLNESLVALDLSQRRLACKREFYVVTQAARHALVGHELTQEFLVPQLGRIDARLTRLKERTASIAGLDCERRKLAALRGEPVPAPTPDSGPQEAAQARAERSELQAQLDAVDSEIRRLRACIEAEEVRLCGEFGLTLEQARSN